MKTKLTLRMEEALIEKAKGEAKRRGKSVSGMVTEFFDSLKQRKSVDKTIPPLTSALVGILKGKRVSEAGYKKHLKEKYL